MYNMLEAMQVKFTKTDKLFLKNVRPDNLDVILSTQIIGRLGRCISICANQSRKDAKATIRSVPRILPINNLWAIIRLKNRLTLM